MDEPAIHPSWRGTLCSDCRPLFDVVVERRKTNRPGFSGMKWWKRFNALDHHSCSVCKVAHAAMRHKHGPNELSGLERREARLTARAFNNFNGRQYDEMEIYGPNRDPTAESRKHPNPMDHSILARIIVEPVTDLGAFGDPQVSSGSTSSDETFAKIRRWLQICSGHGLCNQWPRLAKASDYMPTRLIEIEASSSTPFVRLVHTDDLPLRKLSYATLSHCWGHRLPIQLKTGNMDSLAIRIKWNSLPKTFQEAIRTTTRLGLKYIWIDVGALCIIQDSREDWSTQAAAMASVYANSTFNISADASNSGYSGLFRERAPDFASAFLVSRDNDDDHHFCYVDTYHRDVISSPLGRRAWVVQERFLSPRVIHFGNHQVHFECMQWATSEFRPDTFEADTLPVHTFKRLPGTFDHTSLTHTASQADLYRLWDELVLRYTDCDLTYASDMPVAIEGLARIFAELLGLRFEDYLHGLWRPRLAHELMWRLFAGKKRLYEYQRTSEVSAPSWSWLSIPEGSCSSRFDVIFRGNGKDSLTVLDINHVQPQSSSLRVRGKLCGATFERSGQAAFYVEYMDEEHQPAWIVTVGRTQFRQVESCSIHWDEQSFEIFEYLQGQQLYLLLGREYEEPQEVVEAARRNRSRDSFDWTDVSLQCKACRYDCLILAATEQDTYFRRVGYVSFGGPGGRQRWGDEERRAWFEQERPVLDRQFCLDDVPTHLYEDVDEDHEYTIWLV